MGQRHWSAEEIVDRAARLGPLLIARRAKQEDRLSLYEIARDATSLNLVHAGQADASSKSVEEPRLDALGLRLEKLAERYCVPLEEAIPAELLESISEILISLRDLRAELVERCRELEAQAAECLVQLMSEDNKVGQQRALLAKYIELDHQFARTRERAEQIWYLGAEEGRPGVL